MILSWNQLLTILQTSRSEAEDNASQKPIACPVHGEPLDTGTDPTELHCPVGHFVDADYNAR